MTKVNVTIENSVSEKTEHYKFGTFFLDTKMQKLYILALVSYNEACLVSVNDGNRFSEAVEFAPTIGFYIQADDLDKIVDNQIERFVEIDKIEITVN